MDKDQEASDAGQEFIYKSDISSDNNASTGQPESVRISSDLQARSSPITTTTNQQESTDLMDTSQTNEPPSHSTTSGSLLNVLDNEDQEPGSSPESPQLNDVLVASAQADGFLNRTGLDLLLMPNEEPYSLMYRENHRRVTSEPAQHTRINPLVQMEANATSVDIFDADLISLGTTGLLKQSIAETVDNDAFDPLAALTIPSVTETSKSVEINPSTSIMVPSSSNALIPDLLLLEDAFGVSQPTATSSIITSASSNDTQNVNFDGSSSKDNETNANNRNTSAATFDLLGADDLMLSPPPAASPSTTKEGEETTHEPYTLPKPLIASSSSNSISLLDLDMDAEPILQGMQILSPKSASPFSGQTSPTTPSHTTATNIHNFNILKNLSSSMIQTTMMSEEIGSKTGVTMTRSGTSQGLLNHRSTPNLMGVPLSPDEDQNGVEIEKVSLGLDDISYQSQQSPPKAVVGSGMITNRSYTFGEDGRKSESDGRVGKDIGYGKTFSVEGMLLDDLMDDFDDFQSCQQAEGGGTLPGIQSLAVQQQSEVAVTSEAENLKLSAQHDKESQGDNEAPSTLQETPLMEAETSMPKLEPSINPPRRPSTSSRTPNDPIEAIQTRTSIDTVTRKASMSSIGSTDSSTSKTRKFSLSSYAPTRKTSASTASFSMPYNLNPDNQQSSDRSNVSNALQNLDLEAFWRWAICLCVVNFDLELGQGMFLALVVGT
jgi:hypothetical protein